MRDQAKLDDKDCLSSFSLGGDMSKKWNLNAYVIAADIEILAQLRMFRILVPPCYRDVTETKFGLEREEPLRTRSPYHETAALYSVDGIPNF
jgi:hypothetical protein